jgi:hypothetical protein
MNMTTLNWMPKLHKNPYRERYNDGCSNWSTKELSITMTIMLSAVKERPQSYYDKVYSRTT